MSEESERLVAEIPPELKKLVDADQRTNKEVVEAALWREFGGERLGAVERRIEEKKDRISMLERERNERNREIEQEKQELEALLAKYDTIEEEETVTIEDAMENLSFEELNVGTFISSSESTVEKWADRLDMDVEEFKREAMDRYDG